MGWAPRRATACARFGEVKLESDIYQLIRFLCKDRFIDPWQTRGFVTAAAPLTRSILDSLFALVYLFDDIRGRSDDFAKGGWREMCEETGADET